MACSRYRLLSRLLILVTLGKQKNEKFTIVHIALLSSSPHYKFIYIKKTSEVVLLPRNLLIRTWLKYVIHLIMYSMCFSIWCNSRKYTCFKSSSNQFFVNISILANEIVKDMSFNQSNKNNIRWLMTVKIFLFIINFLFRVNFICIKYMLISHRY